MKSMPNACPARAGAAGPQDQTCWWPGSRWPQTSHGSLPPRTCPSHKGIDSSVLYTARCTRLKRPWGPVLVMSTYGASCHQRTSETRLGLVLGTHDSINVLVRPPQPSPAARRVCQQAQGGPGHPNGPDLMYVAHTMPQSRCQEDVAKLVLVRKAELCFHDLPKAKGELAQSEGAASKGQSRPDAYLNRRKYSLQLQASEG